MGQVLIFAWKVELELEVGERTVWSWFRHDDGDVADDIQMLS